MKTATVRDLRYSFARIAKWLRAGESVEVTYRGKKLARLIPVGGMIAVPPKPPDFEARLKRLFRRANERLLQLLLDELEEAVMAHGVEHVFQPRLVAVGAVAMLDEHAHDGIGNSGRFFRLDDDVGIFREILVSGDAAKAEAKPDPGLDAETILHLERREGDVVGFLENRDPAGTVEGDVELARQSVQRAIVENV